jgi:acetyl-CoA carboxylase carboxyl transferase subunit beta
MADDKPAKDDRGWIARLAPGVRRLIERRKTPPNLWVRCPATGEMIYRPDLEAALWVTPAGHHMRIGRQRRFACTFDGGQFEVLASPPTPDDPLNFTYGKPYRQMLDAARATAGEDDAMGLAVGKIGGTTTVVLVQDFSFLVASVSTAMGEAFVAAAGEAVSRQAPLVVFASGAGMRMQEGALALMQMARITVSLQRLRALRLPYIVVLTDPTTGGTLASFGMLGDVQLAEPGALIGFTGRRVIEQTIRETLPPGFQTAEFQVEHGAADRVVTRQELPAVLGSLLKTQMMGRNRLSAA